MTEPLEPLVMVVDDDPTIRLLCEQSLVPAGFKVSSFLDGETALQALSQLQPDIILLDVEMPGVDGFSVCQEIRARKSTADIPIVMITGNDDTKSINRAYDLGATDFVRKPIGWAVLPHRIRYLLRAKTAFTDLKHAERKTQALLQTIPDAMLIIESNGVIREFVGGDAHNSNSSGEYAGRPLDAFFPPEAAKKIREYMHIALAKQGIHVYEHELDGGKRHCETRLIAQDETCVLAIVRDVTDRKESEATIHKLAYYDNLTGLGNRAYLQQRIIESIKIARRRDQKFALLFFDLDGFKDINDSLGHQAGDELLQAISERLQGVLREMDFAARLGGDEFCVLIEDIADDFAAAKVATKCLKAIAEPIVIADRNLQPRASVGITLFPQNGQDYESLLQTADSAMYVAKYAGKHRYAFYTPDLTIAAERRMSLEHDLRRSIQLGEFELHYQPQVALDSGRVVGVEALVRWRHPERGLVPPNEFIQVTERIGLIEELGDWVLRTACQQAVVWRESGLPTFRVAVNISGLHFRDGKIVDAVREVLEETGLEAARLEVEITESAVQTTEQILDTFMRLRELGVAIAIDDFGTGYSCLASLKHLPIDSLKVDQAFLNNLLDDADYSVIVGTIIAMGRAMRLNVVAEGVETLEQVQYLSALGCNVAQGYFFSRPVPREQIPDLIVTSFLPEIPQGSVVALTKV